MGTSDDGSEEGTGWRIERVDDEIRARFMGTLSAREGVASAEAFRRLASSLSRFDVVFTVGEMEGFETGARKAWQNVLTPVRRRIRTLSTVGARPIVRLGASTLGMLTGVPVRHY